MKLVVTAVGGDLDAEVDPRFGRAPYFVAVETDDMSFEAVENAAVDAGIKVTIGAAGTVREAVERYLKGEYAEAESPNVEGGFGSS